MGNSGRQVSLDDGATWLPANAPVVVAAEGTQEVRYRAVDATGRASVVGAMAPRIDRGGR